MKTLDLIVLLAYLVLVVGVGFWFARRSGSSEGFMKAGGRLPGWVIGLSLFGTYLSSNTFIGVPGKAYAGNWNSFVFSLTIPIAIVIAARYFVNFYRDTGEISAYEHLERRFGVWARVYAVVCYLLTQVARTATIMLGVAIGLQQVTGWDLATIILVAGILVTAYTLIGGIEAVIWTDAIQSVVLTLGALVVIGALLLQHPEGASGAIQTAFESDKFSLGSWDVTDVATSTVWVVLIYGLFINLTNFGIDQNYIQRYHAAETEAAAKRSLWIGAMLYVPVSLLFFLIGSLLFSFYESMPGEVAAIQAMAGERKFEDSILPHFMANYLPAGVGGLILAALAAAAMSTIDTSLNSSATITLKDLWGRLVRKGKTVGEAESMKVLRGRYGRLGDRGYGDGVAAHRQREEHLGYLVEAVGYICGWDAGVVFAGFDRAEGGERGGGHRGGDRGVGDFLAECAVGAGGPAAGAAQQPDDCRGDADDFPGGARVQ